MTRRKSGPRTIKIHWNRHANKWTLHQSGQCLLAATFETKVKIESIYKPHKKANPRAWLSCRGVIYWDGDHAIIRSS